MHPDDPMNHDAKKRMQLVAVIEAAAGGGEKKKKYWNRIGIAFENRDGSWNLRFDYVPARISETTIPMREFGPQQAPPKGADDAHGAHPLPV
jgi:hypothetical protein